MFADQFNQGDLERIKTELSWVNSQNLKHLRDGEVCQCGTEELIARSDDACRLRAALLALIFIDQFVYSHYPQVHVRFRSEFAIPKLRQHSFGMHASPSWFVYVGHGFDKKADWKLISEIFTGCTQHLHRWLRAKLNRPVPELLQLVQQEVSEEFNVSQHDYLEVYFGV